jgi:hypothetical protein
MDSYGGRTGHADELLSLPRRCRLMLQAAALAILLLELSLGISAAQVASTSKAREHVYLLRGAFNVFSLGLDQIEDNLQAQGINVTIHNYLVWSSLADEATADYKSGRVRTIVLAGHSSGATAVTTMAARLGERGVPVKLAIGLDPTSPMTASGHVDRYVNYYIANGYGFPVKRGPQFTGVLQNIDLEKMPDIGHFNIEKNHELQEKVIKEIRAAILGSLPRATQTSTPRGAAAAVGLDR